MRIEIVNGYVCCDGSDVERAKKGEDPARPDGAAIGSRRTGLDAMSGADAPLGVNRPRALGDRGTVLNVLL